MKPGTQKEIIIDHGDGLCSKAMIEPSTDEALNAFIDRQELCRAAAASAMIAANTMGANVMSPGRRSVIAACGMPLIRQAQPNRPRPSRGDFEATRFNGNRRELIMHDRGDFTIQTDRFAIRPDAGCPHDG